MATRRSFTPPASREMSDDPSKQTVWYDTLGLPDDATVKSEVLPTIETAPIDEAYAIVRKNPLEGLVSRGMARSGIIALEVFGPPRARRPWRPRG